MQPEIGDSWPAARLGRARVQHRISSDARDPVMREQRFRIRLEPGRMARLDDHLPSDDSVEQGEKARCDIARKGEAGWELDQGRAALVAKAASLFGETREQIVAIDQALSMGDRLGQFYREAKIRRNAC